MDKEDSVEEIEGGDEQEVVGPRGRLGEEALEA